MHVCPQGLIMTVVNLKLVMLHSLLCSRLWSCSNFNYEIKWERRVPGYVVKNIFGYFSERMSPCLVFSSFYMPLLIILSPVFFYFYFLYLFFIIAPFALYGSCLLIAPRSVVWQMNQGVCWLFVWKKTGNFKLSLKLLFFHFNKLFWFLVIFNFIFT